MVNHFQCLVKHNLSVGATSTMLAGILYSVVKERQKRVVTNDITPVSKPALKLLVLKFSVCYVMCNGSFTVNRFLICIYYSRG